MALPSQNVLNQVPSLSAQAFEADDTKFDIDQKVTLEHNEQQQEARLGPAYTEYSLAQTGKAFWKAVLFSGLIAVGAMYDAYVVSGE